MGFWRRRTRISTWLEIRFAEARPRALAALARQFRDLDLAEEVFSDACVRALATWPERGLPDDPFAWLLATARNAGIDRIRRVARAPDPPEPPPFDADEDDMAAALDAGRLRDDVLRLLFICCHPALVRRDQLALALKVVAGLSTAEIARAFLVGDRAMEQRLTRAKRTIAANPVPFETPDPAERHRRLSEVSAMVYLMFNEGWSATAGTVQIRQPLCDEAIRLSRLLLDLFPGMAESMGLLALMLFQNARRAARLSGDELVPLDAQDRALWDRRQIAEARVLLQKAARHGPAGPYQLQARIAEAHATAPSDAETDWTRIDALYTALHALQPTPVIRLNQAAAAARARGPDAGLAMLDGLEVPLAGYRWFHTTRAALLEQTGRTAEAASAWRAALSLSPTDPEARWLEARIADCEAAKAGA